jgi:hypothetical protein
MYFVRKNGQKRHNPDMAENGFEQVRQQLEQTVAELKVNNNPARRRVLLKEMSRLVMEAQRISSQPPGVRNTDN